MGKNAYFDETEVKRAIESLHPDGELFEIRILGGGVTFSGYFKDADAVIDALANINLYGLNVYITLNQIKDDCFSRKQSQRIIKNAKPTTSDDVITRYLYLFIDLDPARISGVSSTEDELKLSFDLAKKICTYMQELGAGHPIKAVSGNGSHLIYRIDLENTEDNQRLIENCLSALDAKFSTEKIKVDTANFNPSRICKLYGTLAQKGAHTESRPHRMSRIVSADDVTITPIDVLKKLAEQKPREANDVPREQAAQTKKSSHSKRLKDEDFDLKSWLDSHAVIYRNPESYKGGLRYPLPVCPFNPDHINSASVFVGKNGKYGFKCNHDSCKKYHWKDFRLKFEPDAYDKPLKSKKGYDGKGKPPLAISDLESYLDALGVTIRLNLITHDIEFNGLPEDYNPESSVGDLSVILSDELLPEYSSCNKDRVLDLLRVVAGKHRYNPVVDYLNSLVWDGVDYLSRLYQILNIKQEDTLSRILIKKWLCQCVVLANRTFSKISSNDGGADGVLVIQGNQGIGKTTLGRVLGTAHGFFTEGMYIDKQDKDTVRRCVSNWIIELGEIETTLKHSDVERLKSFITRASDVYRVPYGRTDETHVRRTSIMATCNSTDFLVDPSGSRRFWTVPLDTINLAELRNFNIDGLWAQIVKVTVDNGEDYFHLTSIEQAMLRERNSHHEKLLKAEAEIRDIFEQVDNNTYLYETIVCTPTEWKSYYPELNRYDSSQVGKVLKKLGCEQSRDTKNRKYELPVPKGRFSPYSMTANDR